MFTDIALCVTYESLDEACEAAERESFQPIMEWIGDDGELCFDDVEGGCGDCYVTYGHYDAELGCVIADHYYRVYVIETMR